MKRRKNIVIVLIILLSCTINAQNNDFKKLETGVNVYYGLSGLSGSLTNGNIKSSMGYQFYIDEKFNITSVWGIGIGAGYGKYASVATIDNYTSAVASIDDENESFEYRLTATGIKEQLSLSAFEIPVFVTIKKPLSGEIKLQASAGLKMSLPLSATYQCTEGYLQTKGYYSTYNIEFSDMPNHGFETVDKISYSGKLTTNTAYSLFGDIGLLFPVGNIGIKVSIYGSYGLNSSIKTGNGLLMDYPGIYHSTISLSDKVSLISFGLKLGVVF